MVTGDLRDKTREVKMGKGCERAHKPFEEQGLTVQQHFQRQTFFKFYFFIEG